MFACDEQRGNGNLISIAEIKKTSCHFLEGDFFVIKLFLRLKMPENETFEVSSDYTSATCTV